MKNHLLLTLLFLTTSATHATQKPADDRDPEILEWLNRLGKPSAPYPVMFGCHLAEQLTLKEQATDLLIKGRYLPEEVRDKLYDRYCKPLLAYSPTDEYSVEALVHYWAMEGLVNEPFRKGYHRLL